MLAHTGSCFFWVRQWVSGIVLSAGAVTHGERAAGLMAEQSASKGWWAGRAGALPSRWESWPRGRLRSDAAEGHRRLWICEQGWSAANFHTELAQTVLLSCAALMLVSRHTYGLQTLMGCLDLSRARSPSQMWPETHMYGFGWIDDPSGAEMLMEP